MPSSKFVSLFPVAHDNVGSCTQAIINSAPGGAHPGEYVRRGGAQECSEISKVVVALAKLSQQRHGRVYFEVESGLKFVT